MITATHDDLLQSLSNADLLAPVGFDNAAEPTPMPLPKEVAEAIRQKQMPELPEFTAQAERILSADDIPDLPPRLEYPVGIPSDTGCSSTLQSNGGKVRESLTALLSERVKSLEDVLFLQRLISSVAVDHLHTHRFGILLEQRNKAAAAKTSGEAEAVQVAMLGEAAAIEAGQYLQPDELAFVMEHVQAGRLNIAQNIAGPLVDVQALAKGAGKDWRALATEWAAKAEVPQHCTVAAGTEPGATQGAVSKVSYSVGVQPGEGWILSRYFDGMWFPIQASPDALERASAVRADLTAQRSRAAKFTPGMGGVFRDELVLL
ncbi:MULTISPECIES: hypothetical protein [unclassified Pseudomonas]|uniref:hypothetical protein n=1 Tax=unclassified Pseudomonas TaxID=196821 RepID=UPI00131C3289|nr:MULTISPECIES: hypothetical protein [unclassified Pseudomonas]